MNIKQYVPLVLIFSGVACAEFTAQKDGVAIKFAAYEPKDAVIAAPTRNISASQFTKKEFKPLWLEITNTSDRAIEVSRHAITLDLVDKNKVMNSLAYGVILRPLLTFIGIRIGLELTPVNWEIIPLSIEKNSLNDKYQREVNRKTTNIDAQIESETQEKERQWIASMQTKKPDITQQEIEEAFRESKMQTIWKAESLERAKELIGEIKKGYEDRDKELAVLMEKVCEKYSRLLSWINIANWVNYGVLFGHIQYLSQSNKELDAELSKQLLYDVVVIAPGETIKKLLVIDAKTPVERCTLSIRDPRTQFVKTQFEVAL